jgi:hypothetical protein
MTTRGKLHPNFFNESTKPDRRKLFSSPRMNLM